MASPALARKILEANSNALFGIFGIFVGSQLLE